MATIGINVNSVPSNEVGQYLDENGVAVIGGIHCAILAHEALGTEKIGVVRISLSPFNTEKEVDSFVEIMKQLAK